jgi:hypothetical protein
MPHSDLLGASRQIDGLIEDSAAEGFSLTVEDNNNSAEQATTADPLVLAPPREGFARANAPA